VERKDESFSEAQLISADDIELRLEKYLATLPQNPHMEVLLQFEHAQNRVVFSCLGANYSELSRLEPLLPFILSEARRVQPNITESSVLFLAEQMFSVLQKHVGQLDIVFDGLSAYRIRRMLSVSMAGLPSQMYDFFSVPLKLAVSSGLLSALLAALLGGIVGITLAPAASLESFLAGAATGELSLIINYLSSLANSAIEHKELDSRNIGTVDTERVSENKVREGEEIHLLTEKIDRITESLDKGLLQLSSLQANLERELGELHERENSLYSIETQALLALNSGPRMLNDLIELGVSEDQALISRTLQLLLELGVIKVETSHHESVFSLSEKNLSHLVQRLVLRECQQALEDGKKRWVRLRDVGFPTHIYSVTHLKSSSDETGSSDIVVEIDVVEKYNHVVRKKINIREILYIGSDSNYWVYSKVRRDVSI
jgi:hypothetical protein